MALWTLGLGTVFSFNIWEDYKLFGKTFFDLLDFLSANLIDPLVGLYVTIFAAWLIKSKFAE